MILIVLYTSLSYRRKIFWNIVIHAGRARPLAISFAVLQLRTSLRNVPFFMLNPISKVSNGKILINCLFWNVKIWSVQLSAMRLKQSIEEKGIINFVCFFKWFVCLYRLRTKSYLFQELYHMFESWWSNLENDLMT